MSTDEDDPVIVSYDVYIAPPLPQSKEEFPFSSKLYILQYPSHRPSSKPYNAARNQKPTRFRVKPNTGVMEVDVPILTNENYNANAGSRFGKTMMESRNALTVGHGLSSGFANVSLQPAPRTTADVDLNDIPEHDTDGPILKAQTLGGKMAPTSDSDPIYMLGSFRDGQVHLTHIDGVVQLRPQLHHLDAEEEINQRANSTAAKMKSGLDSNSNRVETKAIEMKLKDSNKDAPDRNQNENAKLLRDIQADEWRTHDWVDEDNEAAQQISDRTIHFPTTLKSDDADVGQGRVPRLESLIDNDEWLDKMSSPGMELRTRLKGRDRERARRKRQEKARIAKADAGTATANRVGPFVEDSVTESSSEEEEDDVQDGGKTVKQEREVIAGTTSSTATGAVPPTGSTSTGTRPAPTPASAPRKRGRPKKQTEVIDVDG